MLNIIRAALAAGRATTAYPQAVATPPAAFRGRPVFAADSCEGTAACVTVCPAQAIELDATGPGAPAWTLDMARCVFCGLCEAACPTGAISFSGDFELAARRRADLLVGVGPDVEHAPASAASLGSQFSSRVQRLLRRSLHVRHMDAGSDNSTDWELSALLGPVYDFQRLGIDVVASPRHADVLFVTGAVTRNLAMALQRTYDAMPRPQLVVAAGAEACGGGVVRGGYAVAGGVDQCLPVDIYIPGDPPRPEAIIYGLLLAMDSRR